jgi:hypothetical protein
MRDFGFGPVKVEFNEPQSPEHYLARFRGIDPPMTNRNVFETPTPERYVVQADGLTSGNVRAAIMQGTGDSAPSLPDGFHLLVRYEDTPTEQDLLEHRLMAPYRQKKALNILRGIEPPPEQLSHDLSCQR